MKRNRKKHPAVTAFIVTLTLLLGMIGAFTAVWNTRSTLFGDTGAGVALQQTEQGLQLQLFDKSYAVTPDDTAAWLCVIPPPIRAAALFLETQADLIGRWLQKLIE